LNRLHCKTGGIVVEFAAVDQSRIAAEFSGVELERRPVTKEQPGTEETINWPNSSDINLG
jgi:hypothetical protein